MPPYLTRIAPRWSLTHFVGVCALAFFALGRFIRNVATRWRLRGSGAALTVAALVLVACGHESKPLSPSERIRAESVEVTTLPNGAEFYLSDAQESPLAVVDANGTVRSRAAYHAYGQVRHQVGASGDAFGFLRNEEDRGAGLSDFGARPYRPELGVFLAPDPVGLFEPEKVVGKPTVGQGYAYASGDPINTIDRDGRCGTPYAVTGMGCEKNYGPQLPEAAQKAVDEGATHAPEHVFTFLAIVDGVGVVAAGARFLAVAVTRKLLGAALKEGAEAIVETAVSMAAKGGVEGAVAKGATAPVAKFSDYIFKEGAPHGKDAVFRSLGYGKEQSAHLAQMWEQQAAAKFANGEYTLGKLDQYGHIEIQVPGIGEAAGKVSNMQSGWMIQPEGGITLNTPFSGFTR